MKNGMRNRPAFERLHRKKHNYTKEDLDLVLQLQNHEDPNVIFGAAVADIRRNDWIGTHNVVESKIRSRTGGLGWFIEQLLPKGIRKDFRDDRKLHLPLDHVRNWRRVGERGLVCVTSAPYHVESDDISGLARLVDVYGLEVNFNPWRAWYYSGCAELIEIWRSSQDMNLRPGGRGKL